MNRGGLGCFIIGMYCVNRVTQIQWYIIFGDKLRKSNEWRNVAILQLIYEWLKRGDGDYNIIQYVN